MRRRTGSPLALAPALALVLTVAPAPAQAQTPARAGAIEAVFADLDQAASPGCAVGVVEDGALTFADGYGIANLDHGLPITPETVFYMGSVSKQFTAGAVLLAARRGALSLDDDVRKWIPELPDYGAPITVRHLVYHTSGIRDYLTLQSIAGGFGGVTDEEVIALLARQKELNFEPGERYLYSNSGYFLLSEILERATGSTLREYAAAEFFQPLGMEFSRFHDDASRIIPNRATGYAPGTDGYRMNHAWDFAQVGSGGLYSNVVDMARWETAFDAAEVGDPGFRDAMLERGTLASGDTLEYAFGLAIGEYRGLRTIAHGGSLAGFRAHLLRFPDEHTSVIVLCNATNADPGGRATRVAELVLGDRLDPAPPAGAAFGDPEVDSADAGMAPPAALTAAQRAEYLGRYHSAEVDATLTIRVRGDTLMLAGAGWERPLRPRADDVLTDSGSRLRFVRDQAGRVTGYVLDAGRANGILFERVPD